MDIISINKFTFQDLTLRKIFLGYNILEYKINEFRIKLINK